MERPTRSMAGCGDCYCRSCLYWWSARCPHGECWDDHRAVADPYDRAHPGDPPRTGWSNWRGDQAHWCRGGVCYPQHSCSSYIRYTGQRVEQCLMANVSRFQDGYIGCPILDTVGCEACYARLKVRKEANHGKAIGLCDETAENQRGVY